MNKKQLNYYRMFLAVQNVLDTNTGIWSGNPKFADTKVRLDSIISLIEDLGEETSKNTKGETRTKNQVREALEKKLVTIAGVLAAHAALTNDESLKNTLITSKAALQNSKETDLVNYSNTLLSQATDLQEVLLAEYGVSGSEIEDITTTAAEFKPLIGQAKPKQAMINAAKKTVENQIDEGNQLLRDVIDKLMLRYRFTEESFYNQYDQARTIVDT